MSKDKLHNSIKDAWGLCADVIAPLNSGISSRAQLVRADGAQYILRRLSSSYQGDTEYDIATRLAPLDISPKIIQTLRGHSFTTIHGQDYNLQQFVDGQPIKGCKYDLICCVARITAQMHRALEMLHDRPSVEDRFSLHHLLEECDRERLKQLLSGCSCSLETFENYCISLLPLEEIHEQWIHGDLGSWNVLVDGDQIKIIDFGESRKGSIYFDIAALLTSLLSTVEDLDLCQQHIRLFTEIYAKHNVRLELDTLFLFIQLWFARGIVANASPNLYKAKASEQAVSYFLKQANKFRSLYHAEIS